MKLLPTKKVKVDGLAKELARIQALGTSRSRIVSTLRALREERETVLKMCKRRGRAKGGGQSSKQKGRSAVILVRDLLLRTYDLKPDDVLVKATSQGGCDVHLSPRAQKLFPFGIEVKGSESLSTWAALAQAEVNARKKNALPVLFFKRAHSPLYVAFKAEDILPRLMP